MTHFHIQKWSPIWGLMSTWSTCLNESAGELMLATACFSFPNAEWYIGNKPMKAYRGLYIDDFDFWGLRVLDKDEDKWIKLNSLGVFRLGFWASRLQEELYSCEMWVVTLPKWKGFNQDGFMVVYDSADLAKNKTQARCSE